MRHHLHRIAFLRHPLPVRPALCAPFLVIHHRRAFRIPFDQIHHPQHSQRDALQLQTP